MISMNHIEFDKTDKLKLDLWTTTKKVRIVLYLDLGRSRCHEAKSSHVKDSIDVVFRLSCSSKDLVGKFSL